ncbi:hypothetical protein [Alteribacillus sp. HJP-4]|uniref:hypothetical protein n=1 Tax=Alteribacillus sp. HJP-4 TaxID=2775394 RepID=UPI0035CD1E3C
MKKILYFACFLFFTGTAGQAAAAPPLPVFDDNSEVEEQEAPAEESGDRETAEEYELYIDGQSDSLSGPPVFNNGELLVPLTAAVRGMNEFAEVERNAVFTEADSAYDYLEENQLIVEIDGREFVNVTTLQDAGLTADWKDDSGRLHLETADMLSTGNIRVGESIDDINNKIDIHWNTAFGNAADYIGFHGNMHEFTYTDRFGENRTGEVPDLQVEAAENQVTYLILSSSEWETARGAAVGDSLFDVARAHGSDYIQEEIDGKTVHIYHVNNGSLWFIANENKDVERIGLWSGQLEGYER